ncbi:LysR family transcriptional regulator [Plastoroseomonas hellenica]|uniref:LysR family transcriptional regulator n=1 Tax=Plastoroseomonas hellenica TaxID=2687306 RepID=UPI001BAA3359|nr:LysR family transcriptional regulator [Plastoroseomonas hellenica]MBR0643049.1 LysR family transcriptional regulator [Plastoroseomonas hellenica]
MNLRAIDLNLLVALDALLAERHVTRAGARVGLSQPAMSNALSRLRALFGDALLVRTPAGMELTPRALELIDPVRGVLRQVERVMTTEEAFDPLDSRRSFTLRLSDLLGRLLLPGLTARLRAQAPHVTLDIVHLPPAGTVDALEADSCDLAVSMGLAHGGSIHAEPVLQDRMVCLMAADHPAAAKTLSLDEFLALRHLKVSISPTDSRFADDVLIKARRSRHVVLNLPHWLVVPDVVRKTDLVAVMPERLARLFLRDRPGLALCGLPFAAAPFAWSLYWHRRHGSSRALAWLRRLVAEAMHASDPRADGGSEMPRTGRAGGAGQGSGRRVAKPG